MKKTDKASQVNEPQAAYNTPLNAEEIWKLFRESDKKFQASEKLLTEKFQETDKKFQETAKQFGDTDKQFKETAKQFGDTDKQFKETDKRIKDLYYLFTTQWGKLLESLVEGDLIRLLNERGIKVQRTLTNVEGNYEGKDYEFDIIAINGETIVIVEVKTTLRPKYVKSFIEKLKNAKTWMHEYKNMNVIGAMAYLKVTGGSRTMAIKKGLFVIRATGNSASIVNDPTFEPRKF